MDIVVRGRHTDVAERFRGHAADKLAKLPKLDGKLSRVDVELYEEHNPRLAEQRSRVELTCLTKGPVVRAEAAAADPYAALDLATAKLEARLRRAADRRRVHHGIRTPTSVAAATAATMRANGAAAPDTAELEDAAGSGDGEPDSPFVVREKVHEARPMTLDQALLEMELVGHDFFLFIDAERDLPSVVYCRRGYHYGVIRLSTSADGPG